MRRGTGPPPSAAPSSALPTRLDSRPETAINADPAEGATRPIRDGRTGGAPRFAGTVLFACDDPGVPWHRIVRADGSLAKGERQRRLLEAEGIPFRGDRVDMRAARLPD